VPKLGAGNGMLGIGAGMVGTAGTAGWTSIGLNCAWAVHTDDKVKATANVPLITTIPPLQSIHSRMLQPYPMSLLAVLTVAQPARRLVKGVHSSAG
jgi:hypothetical protein